MALLVVGGDVGWVLVGQDGTLVDVELCEEDGCDMLRGHGKEEGANGVAGERKGDDEGGTMPICLKNEVRETLIKLMVVIP